MESPRLGYKDENLEDKAQRVRELTKQEIVLVKELRSKINMRNKDEKEIETIREKVGQISNETRKLSAELATYLATEYPHNFKNYNHRYEELLPIERNIPINSIGDIPMEIKKIWDNLKHNKVITNVHNLITINYPRVIRYSKYHQDYILENKAIVFFIDEDTYI
jgi:hypothetical protein